MKRNTFHQKFPNQVNYLVTLFQVKVVHVLNFVFWIGELIGNDRDRGRKLVTRLLLHSIIKVVLQNQQADPS